MSLDNACTRIHNISGRQQTSLCAVPSNEAGAYVITPNVMQDLVVAGKIVDEFGRTVASDTELCKSK